MNLDRFLRDREPAWAELRHLVAVAGGRPERLGAAGVRRLGALYRSAAADLALARRRFPMEPAVPMLEDLVGRSRHLVYATQGRRGSVAHFLGRGYWRRVAERPLPLLIAALLVFAPMGLGAVWAADDPAAAVTLVPGKFQHKDQRRVNGTDLGLSTGQSSALSAQIFTNNIRVTLMAFAGGISAGFITAVSLIYNGLLVGVLGGLAGRAGETSTFVQLVIPHGVLELSCIVVAGCAGLRLGWALVDPGRGPRGPALAREARAAAELALGTAPWLVLAGVVEGFVTPAGWGMGPALAVGLGLGAVFWTLVWVRGRPQPAASGVTPAPGP
ncbi:MAG TPA: stage II sporulation protein M [Acidimicrobiales bacterium]|nr:stage II sporulation protein M [Acidimicrobiales bacterium]